MKPLNKWLVAGSILITISTAQGAAMFTDGFNYSVGGLGTVGNPPWTGGNNNIAVTSGSLLFPNLADTVPSGNELTITSGVSAGTVGANFTATPVSSGTVYYSFLAQCTALPTANNYLTSLLTSGTPNGSGDALAVYVGQQTAGSTFKIGIRHAGSGATYTTGAWATAGTVNLFVVGYTFNPGTGDDSVSLWINPTPGGLQPAADVTFITGTDAASLQVVGFKAQGAATAGNWIFDTLRVGSSWEDVTPAAIPEPSVFALGGMAALLVAVRRKRS